MRTEHVTTVGHDQDVAAWPDVVLPAFQQRSGCDMPAGLLADLAHHAVDRLLTELKLAAGQFPFVPLVLQEKDLFALNGDAFHGHRENVLSSICLF
jgi:hypothetical protein